MERIYFKNGKRKVPLTIENLKQKGNLYKSDLVWYDGLEDWKKASEIEELKDFALNQAPLTKTEIVLLRLKKSLKPALLIYIGFSLLLGVFSGILEKYQYDEFFKIVNANSIANEKEDIAKYGADYKTNPKIMNSGFSVMKENEVYVTNDDYSKSTRFLSFIAVRGADQEQVAYNEHHQFLLRPYRAIFHHANLSIEERQSTGLLLSNFILSALLTNIILLPLLIFGFYRKSKVVIMKG